MGNGDLRNSHEVALGGDYRRASRARGRGLLFLLLGVALLSFSERAQATVISLGTFSFETDILGGLNSFVVGNFTEALSSPPDYPVETPLTFVDAVLLLTRLTGETIELDDLGPGQHAMNVLLSEAFTAARFTATVLNPVFALAGGGTFVPSTTSITADLLPSAAGEVLVPGEAVVSLDIEGTLIQAVPEPATFVAVIAGAGALVLARLRLRRRYD